MLSGPGPVTRDGCAVEVYRQLPVGDEPSIVHALAGTTGSVLDLGTGVGRIADPLVELGHRVVAVDDSADMLAHVRLATTVRSDIESLDLDERFDVVLLASYLINTPDTGARDRLLATVARHVASDGRALIQWHPPEWIDGLEAGRIYSGRIGELNSELEVHERTDIDVVATVRYRTADAVWSQSFCARRLTISAVALQLHRVGLALLSDAVVPFGWLVAEPNTMNVL